jgi:hypothetical protein
MACRHAGHHGELVFGDCLPARKKMSALASFDSADAVVHHAAFREHSSATLLTTCRHLWQFQ